MIEDNKYIEALHREVADKQLRIKELEELVQDLYNELVYHRDIIINMNPAALLRKCELTVPGIKTEE